MEALKAKWSSLNAATQRMIVIGGIGLGMVSLIALASPAPDGDGSGPRGSHRGDTIKHVLTDTDPREVGIDSINANVKALREKNRMLETRIEEIRMHLGRAEQMADKNLKTQVASLSRQLDDARAQQGDLRRELRDRKPFVVASADATEPPSEEAERIRRREAAELFESAPVPSLFDRGGPGDPGPNGAPGSRQNTLSLRVISAAPKVGAEDTTPDDVPYLPSGSIITGTLLTGLDAPTRQGGSSDPTPALLRVEKEAILPNRYTSDIRECFIVMSGYGDLSAERAYLRGETLSCVTDDEQVIETPLKSYAAGEDGKAGIRGRVVSKQGTLLARAMIAGFADGFAKMFSVTPVPVLQTGQPGESVNFQNYLSPQVVQGAAINGASQALNRLSDYYMDMAEQLYPIIEIDSGRTIDVIVTRGAAMPVVQRAMSASNTN
ncbi:MAG: TrbI/VirB10 family protein [Pseudomonadota bacterium]|nr:TrbI/VirB10 family protein [Pseudomonadota bacterium]